MAKTRPAAAVSNSAHSRISAILKLPEASGLQEFAQHLALDTQLDVGQAQGALAACHRDIARSSADRGHDDDDMLHTPFDRGCFEPAVEQGERP